jgi:hypothetical protein
MAPRTLYGVSLFLVSLMPTVHQQYLGHLCMPRSQVGSNQRSAKERRVPSEVHSAFMQQKECYSGGRRQVNHHVLQEMTHGLVLNSQAHHEEPRDV